MALVKSRMWPLMEMVNALWRRKHALWPLEYGMVRASCSHRRAAVHALAFDTACGSQEPMRSRSSIARTPSADLMEIPRMRNKELTKARSRL